MITFRASAAGSVISGTTLNITIPTDVREGDLLVLGISVNTATAQTFGGLTGWTQRANVSLNQPMVAMFTKVATAADAGAVVSPTWQTTATGKAAVAAYSGVDTTNPVHMVTSNNSSGSSTVPLGSPAAYLNDTFVYYYAIDTANTVNTPSGFTARSSSTTYFGHNLGDDTSRVAQPATAYSTTSNTTVSSQGVTLSLRPAQVPIFRAAQLTSTASAGNVSAAQPTSTQVGDLLIASAAAGNTARVWTLPTGWTLVGSQNQGNAIYYRFAATAGAATHSFATDGAAAVGVVIAAYSGVSSVEAVAQSNTGNPTTAPTVTTLGVNRLVVHAIAAGVTTTPAFPTGETQDYSASAQSAVRNAFGSEAVSSAVAVGTRSITGNVAPGVVATLALASPTPVPRVRSARTTLTASSTSHAVNMPPGIVAGDLLLAFMVSPDSITAAPSGWTSGGSITTPFAGHLYYKTAVGGESATTPTWTCSPAAEVRTVVVAVETPAQFHVASFASQDSGVSTTIPTTSLTTTDHPTLLLHMAIGSSTAMTMTPHAGMTAVSKDDAIARSSYAVYEVLNQTGATGTRNGVSSTASPNRATTMVTVITPDPAPTAPSLTSPANNAPVTLNSTSFQWTFNDLYGDTQSAYALRRRAWGSGTYEWWNGSTWVGTETFVTSASGSVTPTGFTNTDDTYFWSVATKDQAGQISPYATEIIVNPWEWWNGTNWVYSTEAFVTSATDSTSIAAAQFAAGQYKWSVATRDQMSTTSPYSADTLFTFGGSGQVERFGNFI